MSHELRTALNAASEALSILSDSELAPRQSELVDLALESLEKMVKVVKEASRLEECSLDGVWLDFTHVSLWGTLRSVVQELASQARERSIDVRYSVDPMCPLVVSNPQRIRQVVQELVSNALQHSRGDTIAIGATCEQRADKRAIVRITVRDTGVGSPQRRIDAILASDNPPENQEGSGLARCLRTAKALKGGLEIESSGQGCAITFSFLADCYASNLARPAEGAPLTASQSL